MNSIIIWGRRHSDYGSCRRREPLKSCCMALPKSHPISKLVREIQKLLILMYGRRTSRNRADAEIHWVWGEVENRIELLRRQNRMGTLNRRTFCYSRNTFVSELHTLNFEYRSVCACRIILDTIIHIL